MTREQILKKLQENPQFRARVAALPTEPAGLTRQEMEGELHSLAQGYSDLIGGPVTVPTLRELEKIPTKKLAKEESSDPEVKNLLRAYNAEEKRMTLDYKAKIHALNKKMKEGLKEIKKWASQEISKEGASKLEIFRTGEKKLQKYKNDMDAKLHALKLEAYKAFTKLENEYKKKHPKFGETLERQKKTWKVFKFAGKVFVGMAISFLMTLLLGLTIKAILFALFIKEAIPAIGETMTKAVAEQAGKNISKGIQIGLK